MFCCGALKYMMHRYGEYIACDKALNKNVSTVRRISVLTKDGVPSCRPDHAQLFRQYQAAERLTTMIDC